MGASASAHALIPVTVVLDARRRSKLNLVPHPVLRSIQRMGLRSDDPALMFASCTINFAAPGSVSPNESPKTRRPFSAILTRVGFADLGSLITIYGRRLEGK